MPKMSFGKCAKVVGIQPGWRYPQPGGRHPGAPLKVTQDNVSPPFFPNPDSQFHNNPMVAAVVYPLMDSNSSKH